MQVEIREATAADNSALHALQARCPQGTSLVLSTVNTPDFFARAKAYSAHKVYVASMAGELVGSAACAIRDAMLAGEVRRVGYEFQYFTAPEHRGRGVARRLRQAIEAWLVEQGAALSSALIIEGNTSSMRLFEREGFRRHRTLEVSVLLPYKPVAVPTRGTVRPIGPGDYPAAARLLNDTWAAYDLYAPISPEGLAAFVARTPAYDPADLWVLEEEGEVVACLGTWDWGRITRVMVERLSRRLRAIGTVLDVVRHLRPAPRLPKAGDTLRQWALTPIAFREPEQLAVLFRHANNEAVRRGADQLITVCERDHPLLRACRGLFRVGVGGHVYVRGLQPLALRGRPVYLDGIDL